MVSPRTLGNDAIAISRLLSRMSLNELLPNAMNRQVELAEFKVPLSGEWCYAAESDARNRFDWKRTEEK